MSVGGLRYGYTARISCKSEAMTPKLCQRYGASSGKDSRFLLSSARAFSLWCQMCVDNHPIVSQVALHRETVSYLEVGLTRSRTRASMLQADHYPVISVARIVLLVCTALGSTLAVRELYCLLFFELLILCRPEQGVTSVICLCHLQLTRQTFFRLCTCVLVTECLLTIRHWACLASSRSCRAAAGHKLQTGAAAKGLPRLGSLGSLLDPSGPAWQHAMLHVAGCQILAKFETD